MQRMTLYQAAMILWGALFFGSFIAGYFTPPDNGSYIPRLNAVFVFLGLQIAAVFASVPVWFMGRAYPRGSAGRWYSRAPIMLAGVFVALIAGLYLYLLSG